ncbi:MAG TPA: shikimate kinase [Gemmatimonadales bacterium]|nr:shikimate kinase [Gemmatimonadales bacterium]
MPRHVVLVGLPGSGKSTVGKLAAEALGTSGMDVDAFLVRQMGMPISQIFGKYGEAEFRSMERGAVQAALGGPPLVLVPGGGWAAQAGELDAARGVGIIIYLKCDAATAAKRSGQGEVRPLLMGEDPVARMRELLLARAPFYDRADHVLVTDQDPAPVVAQNVARIAREAAGW